MGIRAAADSEYFEYARVAVLSARRDAPSLVPYLIFTGAPNEFTAWFEEYGGGTVLFHDLSIMDQFFSNPELVEQSGTFLRLDIPILWSSLPLDESESFEENFALWTDVDVMFLRDVDSCLLPRPGIFALGGEFKRNTKANAGIMYMNVPRFGNRLGDLIAFGQQRGWDSPAYDQGLLLAFFRQDEITQLGDRYNWKGYWGKPEEDVAIIHWHGPKPRRYLPCLVEQASLWRNLTADEIGQEKCGLPAAVSEAYSYLVTQAPERGAYYKEILQLYERYSLTDLTTREGTAVANI